MSIDITNIIRKNITMCRLCLENDKPMSSIFYNSQCSLVDKIKSLASVQILPNDGLPSLICSECRSKIENYIEFRKQIENSYNYLLNMVRNQGTQYGSSTSNILKNIIPHDSQDVTLPTSSTELPFQKLDKQSNRAISILKDKKINIISDTVVKTVGKSINIEGGFQPILGDNKMPVGLFNEVLDIDLLSQSYNKDLCLNKINLNFQINNNSGNRYDFPTVEYVDNVKLPESCNIVDDPMNIYIENNKNLNVFVTEPPLHNHTIPLEINSEQQLFEEINMQKTNIHNSAFDELGNFLKSQTNIDYDKLKQEMQNLKNQNVVIKTEEKQDQKVLWKKLAQKGILIVDENKDHYNNIHYEKLKQDVQNLKCQNVVIKTEEKQNHKVLWKKLAQKGIVVVGENKDHSYKPTANIKLEMQNSKCQNDVKTEEKLDHKVLWKKLAQKGIVVVEENKDHKLKSTRSIKPEMQNLKSLTDIKTEETQSKKVLWKKPAQRGIIVAKENKDYLCNPQNNIDYEKPNKEEPNLKNQVVIKTEEKKDQKVPRKKLAQKVIVVEEEKPLDMECQIVEIKYDISEIDDDSNNSSASVEDSENMESLKDVDDKSDIFKAEVIQQDLISLEQFVTLDHQMEIAPRMSELHRFMSRKMNHEINEHTYVCHLCLSSFTSSDASLAEKHSAEHSKKTNAKPLIIQNTSPFHCEICQKKIATRQTFIFHQRMHFDIYPFKCKSCSEAYTSQELLKKHEVKHVKCEDDYKFKCNICDEQFKNNLDHKYHKHTHLPKDKLMCPTCKKCFVNLVAFRIHQKRHTNRRSYICKECPATFFTKTNFTRHKRIHEGLKLFPCGDCQKAFCTNFELRRHQRYHSKDKQHFCKICNKAFYEAGHLRIHLITHTKNYKHICDICGKAFPTMSKLNRHLEIHNNTNVFTNEGVPNMLLKPNKVGEQTTNNNYSIVVETNQIIQKESDLQMYTDGTGKLYVLTDSQDFKNDGTS